MEKFHADHWGHRGGSLSTQAQDGPSLQVHGSWQLIQTLLSHELIDEFRLWFFPVLVGAGKRLFGQETVPTGLTLVKTKTTSNGVMMGIYRRASKIEGGSFAFEEPPDAEIRRRRKKSQEE